MELPACQALRQQTMPARIQGGLETIVNVKYEENEGKDVRSQEQRVRR